MEFRVPQEIAWRSGVYKITNTVNGKFYIGSAVKFKKRFRDHTRELMAEIHDNEHLIRSYKKYGGDKFTFECLEVVDKKENLIPREQFYIDSMMACDLDIGYNICPTAGSTLGLKRTQESKDNMSRVHGRKVYQWCVEDGSLLGEYESIGFAEQATGLSRNGIRLAAMGYTKKNKYFDFIWTYEDKEAKTTSSKGRKISDEFKDYLSEVRGTKIFQKNMDGTIISEYKNARFAEAETGIKSGQIRLACRKGIAKHGYMWEYAEPVKNGGKTGKNAVRFGANLSIDQLIEISRKSGPVIQYDLDMNIIKEHQSLIEAHISTGISKLHLKECCMYNKHNYGGFIFRLKNGVSGKDKYKKFFMFNDDLEEIEIFDSIYLACEKYGLLTASIYQAIRKNFKCGGFYWKSE